MDLVVPLGQVLIHPASSLGPQAGYRWFPLLEQRLLFWPGGYLLSEAETARLYGPTESWSPYDVAVAQKDVPPLGKWKQRPKPAQPFL